MVDAVFRSKDTGRSLFTALLDARDAFGARTMIAEDIERKPIGYDRVVVGSAALGRALAAGSAGRDACGAADAECGRLAGGVHGAAGVRHACRVC